MLRSRGRHRSRESARLATAGNAALVLAGLLLLWQAIILVFHVPAFMLPGPAAVLHAVLDRSSSLTESFLITATAAAAGLGASIVVGTTVALLFAQSRWLRRMFLPYTILLQTVPIVAIAPLILMWVGPGTVAVTVIAFIICLAPIIANTTQGLIGVDENMVNLFLMQNASAMQVLFKLRLPHALPAMFTGIPHLERHCRHRRHYRRVVCGVSLGRPRRTRAIRSAMRRASYKPTTYSHWYLRRLYWAFFSFSPSMFLEYYFLHNWHESAQRGER